MKKRGRKLTKGELRKMATARVGARMVSQVIESDGKKDFVDSWIPRLGGYNVMKDGTLQFKTRDEAVAAARSVKQSLAEFA